MSYGDELPSRAQIFDFWKDNLRNVGARIDWGEPSCWACGFHYGTKYDNRDPRASIETLFALWNAMPLQRCHIVPRSLGGSDEPSNLFLMCRECHDLAPNTRFPELFFEWVSAQSYEQRERRHIEEALNSYSVARDDRDEVTKILFDVEFMDWMKDKYGLHRPQSNYAQQHYRFTIASVVGLAVHYWRQGNRRSAALGSIDS